MYNRYSYKKKNRINELLDKAYNQGYNDARKLINANTSNFDRVKTQHFVGRKLNRHELIPELVLCEDNRLSKDDYDYMSKNKEFKKLKSLCEQYGYNLEFAYIDGNNGLLRVNIICNNPSKYYPRDIKIDTKYSLKPDFIRFLLSDNEIASLWSEYRYSDDLHDFICKLQDVENFIDELYTIRYDDLAVL